MSLVKRLRKIRKICWRLNIVLGDIIAFLSGRFIRRLIRKRILRMTSRAVGKLTRKRRR